MSTPQTDQAKERRANARRPCHRPCLVRFDRRHLDGRAGSVGAEGSIIDLSLCGVGLLLRSAVPPGTTLAVGPFGTEQPPLPLACVVHCVPGDGRWRYGCGLERRLKEEELSAWLA
jgi:PilZ domain